MPVSIVTQEDNLAMMSRYPDKFFDLAVVDPPYGIGASNVKRGGKKHGNSCAVSKDYGNKDWDNQVPEANYFNELIRVSKNQVIWGGNYMCHLLPPSSCWLVWDKLTGENGYADFELAYTSFDKACRKFTFRWQGMLQGNMAEKELRYHPTQKPIILYRWILEKFAVPKQKILDTHLGSGSSRIAAYDLGFDFYGCEKDYDYWLAAENRFKTHIAQQKLFAPEQIKVEQTNLF